MQKVLFIMFVVLAMAGDLCALGSDAHLVDTGDYRVVGVIPITTAGAGVHTYRHVDRMVPELRKISTERMVRLECRYRGSSANPRDVFKAYMIAAQIEKYLREHHKLPLDVWLAAHVGPLQRAQSPSLTVSVFSDDFQNSEKQSATPAMVQRNQVRVGGDFK